jgi:hypothetical protein
LIFKDQIAITDLNTWEKLAGPKRSIHWKDGRSAKEAAKSWLEALPSIPTAIEDALISHKDFSVLREWMAEPEAYVRFDSFRGEPSNVDVLVQGRDDYGPIVIAVEAKGDEPFGANVEQTLKKAEGRLATNPRSKGVARIHNLANALLGVSAADLSKVSSIRYQLLTVSAAALAEAEREGASRAVVMIQEFITSETEDEKHLANQSDLNAFLSALSRKRVEISSGQVFGPISVKGPNPTTFAIGLYIGKVSVNLRNGDA